MSHPPNSNTHGSQVPGLFQFQLEVVPQGAAQSSISQRDASQSDPSQRDPYIADNVSDAIQTLPERSDNHDVRSRELPVVHETQLSFSQATHSALAGFLSPDVLPSPAALPSPFAPVQPIPPPLIQQSVSLEDLNARGKPAKWEPWQDRALARQVLADDPINCIRGRTPEKCLEVSVHLLDLNTPIRRTADSCRSRMKKLVLLHKAEQSRSPQKTGTNEEVDRFIQDMDELVIRWEQGSSDPSIRQEAVAKARVLEEDGKVVRDASLRGLVRKRDELRFGDESNSEAESNGTRKRKKNETARRVDQALEQLTRDDDSVVLEHLQELENRHHSELVSGLKSIADELKEDRLARREEWMDMMRVLSRSICSGRNN